MSYKELAQSAKNMGVSACFGIPGSGASLGIVDEFDTAGIPFYLSHFEGSAAIMAATVGRLSSAPGVSISIKGPGLVNAMPGIATAWFESSPLLHITEATPQNAPTSVAHKRIDQKSMCSPVVKGNYFLGQAEDFNSAASLALSEECGPVLFQIGNGDIELKEQVSLSTVSKADNVDVLDTLRKAHKPVVIVGAYVNRNNLSAKLSELTIPMFTTVAAKGAIDEKSTFSAGIFTGVEQSLTPESQILSDADFIISIGLSAKEVLKASTFSVETLHLGEILTSGLDGFEFDNFLTIDWLDEVISTLKEKSWGEDNINRVKNLLFEKLEQHFLPGKVFQLLQQYFAQEARVVLDTGSFCTIGEYMWQAKTPNQFLASAQGRYMGTSLPMSIGASLFDSSMPTIAVMGDGGIGMYLADVKLSVNHQLPLLIVLMSDGGFGSIRYSARKNKYKLENIQTDSRSWVACLYGLGVPGQRVINESEFGAALSKWKPQSGPYFLEVMFDPDLYEVMVEGVRT